MAIWNILKALGKVGSKTKEHQEKIVKDVLEKEAPKYFDDYTNSQKERRDNRVRELMEPMADAVCDIFNERFDKLERMIESLEAQLEDVQDQNSDMLRRELKKVYHKYRHYKKIPQYDYDDCQKMMTDYTGNSYAEDM